jgi:hypothetical protein
MDRILMHIDKATVEPHKGSPYKEDKSFEIITIPTDRKSIKLAFWCEREEKEMDKRYIAHSDDIDFNEKVEELLLYRKIVSSTKVDDMEAILTLDNGVELIVIGNEGCGGCANGWYYIDELNTCDNVITDVQCLTENECADGKYHIFVFAEDRRINCVSYDGSDNGYYGTGYRLFVRVKENKND